MRSTQDWKSHILCSFEPGTKQLRGFFPSGTFSTLLSAATGGAASWGQRSHIRYCLRYQHSSFRNTSGILIWNIPPSPPPGAHTHTGMSPPTQDHNILTHTLDSIASERKCKYLLTLATWWLFTLRPLTLTHFWRGLCLVKSSFLLLQTTSWTGIFHFSFWTLVCSWRSVSQLSGPAKGACPA